MWKFSRNITFARWPNQKPKYVETNNKPQVLSKTIASYPSTEKKRYSDEDHKKKEQFKQSERFWNCDYLRYHLYKSALLEKVGWLGTVTALCFNFHFKHLQYMRNYEWGVSHCPLSRNVLAMPHDSPKYRNLFLPKEQSPNENLFSNCDKIRSHEPLAESNLFSDLERKSIPYAAAVHNTFGISYLKRNSKKAFRSFQRAATLGSAQAFYNLGLCFELGKGTKTNLIRAAFCYKKAATKGHGLASFNLAVYFLKGLGGLPVDKETAKLLMIQSAEKNVPEAQLFVGLDYLENANYSEAIKIFNTLTKKDVLDAKYYLGICYENGWGVEKSVRTAFEIFSETATLGHTKSILKLSKFYEEGLGGCEPDLDLSTALILMLGDRNSEEWRTTLLRLNIKRALMLNRNNHHENSSNLKTMHNSKSSPELSLFQAKEHRKISESYIARSFLNLFAPLTINTKATIKKTFYLGEEKLDSKLLRNHFQINMPQLMITKS